MAPAVVVGGWTYVLRRRAGDNGKKMTNEERALHGLVYQLESSWNAADGAAFAALFATTPTSSTFSAATTPVAPPFEAGHRMIFGTIYKGSTIQL